MKKGSDCFTDYDGFSIDSYKLQYLMEGYVSKAENAQEEGLVEFWRRAKELSEGEFRPSNTITPQEYQLLKQAKEGSTKAIQRLIQSNPEIIGLPFVQKKMIEILHEYKASQDAGALANIRDVVWPSFLPSRKEKYYVGDEALRRKIRQFAGMPISDVVRLLSQFRDLIRGTDDNMAEKISELMRTVKWRRTGKERIKMTKELAMAIIRLTTPINEKRLKKLGKGKV